MKKILLKKIKKYLKNMFCLQQKKPVTVKAFLSLLGELGRVCSNSEFNTSSTRTN